MIALDCAQRSPAWRLARCGCLTASRAGDVLARGRRGEESRSWAAYRRELSCERLTGTPQDHGFVSAAMQRGLVKEPVAREAYAAWSRQTVHTSGR